MSSDPRARTRTWINTHYDTDNTLKLDGETPLQTHAAYANPLYQLKDVFFGDINNDVELAIHDPIVTVHKHKEVTYAYTEEIPIEIYAVDKTPNVNGASAVWEAEQELRRIAKNYPLYPYSSRRTFTAMQPNSQNMGGWTLHSKRCILSYKRAEEIVPTLPTITYGDSQISTWTWPNADINYPNEDILDAKMEPLNRKGNIKHSLGDTSLFIEITSDTDVAPEALTFERPQTSGSKTDKIPWEIFLEMKHNSDTQDYQILDLGWGSFPVRLVYFSHQDNILTTLFEEYNEDSADGTYQQRYDIT